MDLINKLIELMASEKATGEAVIAIMVAAFGLINVLISVLLTPILTDSKERQKFEREELYKHAVSLVEFISNNTYEKNYSMMEYRKLCMQIHLLFDDGKSPEPISAYMEDIFRILHYKKKGIITVWEHEERKVLRSIVRKMRRELAYYIKRGPKNKSILRSWLMMLLFGRNNYSIKKNTITGLLATELDSQPYVYYTQINESSVDVFYYRFNRGHYSSMIDEKMDQLKEDYGN